MLDEFRRKLIEAGFTRDDAEWVVDILCSCSHEYDSNGQLVFYGGDSATLCGPPPTVEDTTNASATKNHEVLGKELAKNYNIQSVTKANSSLGELLQEELYKKKHW